MAIEKKIFEKIVKQKQIYINIYRERILITLGSPGRQAKPNCQSNKFTQKKYLLIVLKNVWNVENNHFES